MSKNTTTTLPEFDFVQSSQFIGASAAKLETGNDSILADLPSIVTLTEIFHKDRSARLKEKGYSHHHELGTDPAVQWLDADWTCLHAETTQVTNDTYFTASGHATGPQKAAFVVLQHNVSGHRLLVIDNHFPPHVEGSAGPGGLWNMATIRRWKATMSAVRGIKKRKRELQKEFKTDAQLVTGDWNLNVKRLAVRAWIKSQFPRMTIAVGDNYKGQGTLGKVRFIDFTLLKGLAAVAGPFVRVIVGSDHKSARTVLRFTKAPRHRSS